MEIELGRADEIPLLLLAKSIRLYSIFRTTTVYPDNGGEYSKWVTTDCRFAKFFGVVIWLSKLSKLCGH